MTDLILFATKKSRFPVQKIILLRASNKKVVLLFSIHLSRDKVRNKFDVYGNLSSGISKLINKLK